MKKLLIILVSIIMVFGLFGCEDVNLNPNETPAPTVQPQVPKLSQAKTLIEQAGVAMYPGETASLIALGLGLNIDISATYGNDSFEYSANGDAKLKLDYETPENTKAFIGLSGSGNGTGFFENKLGDLDRSIYYAYDEEAEEYFAYARDNEGEEVELLKRPEPFADIFNDSFSALITQIQTMIEEEMEEKEISIPDFTQLPEEITKEFLLSYLAAEDTIIPPVVKSLLTQIINEEITDAALDPDEYFTVGITASKITLTFNYDKFKTLVNNILDSTKSKINDFITGNGDVRETIFEYEGVQAEYDLLLTEEILSEYMPNDFFPEIFTGVDDPDFISLCNYSDTDYLTLPYDTLSNAASDFNMSGSDSYAEWFYENAFEDLKAFVVDKEGAYEINSLLSSVINDQYGEIVFMANAVKEMMPSKFDFSIEIGLGGGKITSFGFNLDVDMKIPYPKNPSVFNDLSLEIDFEITIETDPDDIVISEPENLNQYELEENN